MSALFGIVHAIQPIPGHLSPAERRSMALTRSFEILNATSRPQVLIQLYFKDAIPRFESLLEASSKATEYFRAASVEPDLVPNSSEIAEIGKALRELNSYLLDNVDRLTQEPSCWLRPSAW